MSKTYGILMSGEMIRAYIARMKRETRRVRGLDIVNKAPDEFKFIGFSEIRPGYVVFEHRLGGTFDYRMPYGRKGDTLWFKETYAPMCKNAEVGYCTCETDEEETLNHYIEYRADTENQYPGDWPEEEAKGNPDAPKWRSSMFMRHKDARFKDILIEDVWCERLKSITTEGAKNEGYYAAKTSLYPLEWYFDLWDRLNGKKLPVSANPWVWVYRFQEKELS